MSATLSNLTKRRRRRQPYQRKHLHLLGFVCSAVFFLDYQSFAFVFSSSPFLRLERDTGVLSRHAANTICRPVQAKKKIVDDEIIDDKTLLSTVEKQQLVKLCLQLQLPTKGTKETLLKRLRAYADEQAEMERKILMERSRRVEEGSDNDKERYEIIDDTNDDDENDVLNDGFFFFDLPDHAINVTNKQEEKSKPKKPTSIPNSAVTAPPPPKEPNEKGERVVTVYSTADQNDLTGVAAAQPGQAAMANDNLMTVDSSSNPGNQPWDMQQNQRGGTTSKETEQATETVVELVSILLAMSGAPAFSSVVGGEDLMEKVPSYIPTDDEFVGFDPSKVPTELLVASSQALRTGRGQILDEVIRHFELQAIGQDGIAGDDVEKGGGHYREVTKVRAFLDGYRRAEVRRLARETAAMLLDKLVLEGVEGLDMMLASMARSGDDNAAFSGELNDSLLDYLNSAIRQQEQKVDEFVSKRLDEPAKEKQVQFLLEENDEIDTLWNVTEEDGEQVETIDPNDAKVYNALQREQQKAELAALAGSNIPETAPEQLLLLLTLLRERIKAEGAFGPDEKGRNLRLLAYCLRLSDAEREQLVLKEVGNSLDVS